jgi:enamine deaminase RidA (YjgF/YER057c/UK114 family)
MCTTSSRPSHKLKAMSSGCETDAIPSVRTKRINDARAIELFLQISPSSTRDDERGQFASLAAQAGQALLAHGLGPANIVCGWIHFAKNPQWDWRQALTTAWNASGPLPISAILQPPAAPFCLCTLQLHAIRSARQSGVWYGNSDKPAAATILRAGARHLRLMSITPRADLRDSADLVDMTYDMLAQAGHALTDRGLSFKDVVRTWIYVRDIEHNYSYVNKARSRFFVEQGMSRMPASTCVEGALCGAAAPVAMNLYAVAAKDDVHVDAIAPGTMGEASAYGSAFARASRIVEPGRNTLCISATASIGAAGAVVAVGDIGGQLDCMFANVQSLLATAGMGFCDVVSATAYLKRATDHHAFLRSAAGRGLPVPTPTAVVVADLCRPEWLCAIEMCAVQMGADRPRTAKSD